MIEQGLYQQLTADPGVAALVGKRVFGSLMPKDTALPAIVFSVVSSGTVESLKGRNRAEIARVQFDAYAPNYLDARRLSDRVRDALVPAADDVADDFFPYDLPDGTEIQSAKVHSDVDNPFEIGEGGYVCRSLLDLEFFYIPAN